MESSWPLSPLVLSWTFKQEFISVLIGMTGDIRVRIMIGGTNGCMGKIGESMFGMPLEGEMLESFAAEFGNMLAGNIATSLTDEDALIDITPPTVIVGDTKMDRFHEAIHLPTSLEGVGPLQVTLLIEM